MILKFLRRMFSFNLADFGFEKIEVSNSVDWQRLVLVYFGNINYKNRLQGCILDDSLLIREIGSGEGWRINVDKFEKNDEIFRPLRIISVQLPVSFAQLDDIILSRVDKLLWQKRK